MRPSLSSTTIWYGGDWNPEQWPEPVWAEDLALMRQAGVNLVSLGVFAWSRLEPEPGRYTFGWLDRVLDLAHAAGVRINLATPTASPPPWFSLAHPEALPVTAEGVRLTHGSRDTYCAAAPAYRHAARRIAAALAVRYADHPALAMWHVHNEYGTICYCDQVAGAFRGWLRERYADLAQLNDAWGTSFWGQHYAAWEQVLPPRATQYLPNPHQRLDFRRFWSDQLLAAFQEQRDVLRQANPRVPVTTNFAFGGWLSVDHRRWGSEVDMVAMDGYPHLPAGLPPSEVDVAVAARTAFLADLARHFAGDRPWLLMEQSPGGLSQAGTQIARPPGQLARVSTSYVARGARAVMCFQWRASLAGAEQYHSALVPHAGAQSRLFTEAVRLGAVLPRLAAVEGTVQAPAAIAWHAPSWWALQAPHLPSGELDYLAALHRAHRALWDRQITVDFVDLAGDLHAYRLVLVPSHYLADAAVTASVRRYLAAGGHLVVWYFSGIADRHGRVHHPTEPERPGGHPAAFRDLLGVRAEEFHPLPPGAAVALSDHTEATRWSEHLHLEGAEARLRYADGVLAGLPALTRHRFGAGTAWYVSTELATAAYDRLVEEVLATAGVAGGGLPAGVEMVVRRHAGRSWRFVLNHTTATVEVPGAGVDLVSGERTGRAWTVAPGGFAVLANGSPVTGPTGTANRPAGPGGPST